MGRILFKTTGNAANSGSSDNDSPDLSGAAATVVTTVVTLDGTPDLSAVATSGANQASIALADATNTNQKIFWITAVDNVLKTVTVSVAPTGVGSSAWRIGGRMVYTPANWEAAPRAGDIIEFQDTPASRSGGAFLSTRAAGDDVSGYIRCIGSVGVRPVLTITDTNPIFAAANGSARWWFENIELAQQGASGALVGTATGVTGWVFANVKVSDGGGAAFSVNQGVTLINCEISGVGGDAVASSSNAGVTAHGNYIHDCGGDGIELSATQASALIMDNIIDTCAGRGIYYSGSSIGGGGTIRGNTIYGCGNSGIEIADATNIIYLTNNILQDNGNAAGEYNVEWVAGSAEIGGYHYNNCFYHQGGGGGANLSGLTANATEVTTDPLFVDPANGDFRLQAASPAKGAGFPGQFLGGPLGYLDMGAVQRDERLGGFPRSRLQLGH